MIGGNAYTGKQGEGYATTFPQSKSIAAAAQRKAGEDDAAAKDREAGLGKTGEIKPTDVWHFYGANVQDRWKKWLETGASVMTKKGINNLWRSTEPDAIKWQIDAGEMKQEEANIKQAQELYEKSMQSIASKGNEYTEEYLNEVNNFPLKTSYEAIAKGEYQFPQAKFKNPSNIYNKFLVKDAEALQKQLDGVMPTDAQVKDRVVAYFTAPENETDVVAAKQMYDSLPDPVKDKYKASSELNGLDEPWMGLAFENYKTRFIPDKGNYIEDVLEYAKVAPKDFARWSKEDTEGITKGGSAEKLSDKKFPLNAATSHFAEKSYLLDDESYMTQLGVSMTIPRAERKTKAIAVMADKIRENISLKTESTLSREGEGGGGIGQEELQSSYDLWRERIGSFDQTAADEAANFLFGSKGEKGIIENAHVLMESEAPFRDKATFGAIPNHRVLIVKYKDSTAAKAAMEKFYKTEIENAEKGMGTDIRELLNFYEKQSDGSRIMYPVLPETEQKLKTLHDVSAKYKKSLYKPEYNTGSGDWDNL